MKSYAVTRTNGNYYVQGVEVGGPYVVSVRRLGFAPDSVTGVRLSLGQNFRASFKLHHAGRAARGGHRARDIGYAQQSDLAVAPRRADRHLGHGASPAADAEPQLHRLPLAHTAGAAGAERRPVRGRPEQSLQQHSDRRRERERHLRTRHHRPAGRTGARTIDLARGGAGVSGAAVAVRCAPGELHGRADQRRHEERHERASTARRTTTSAIRISRPTCRCCARAISSRSSSASRSAARS